MSTPTVGLSSEPTPSTSVTQPSVDSERDLFLSECAVVAITSFAHALCHMGELISAGLFAHWTTQFTLTPKQSTSLPWIGITLFGLGAIPVGLLSERWGATRLLLSYFLLLALSSVAVGLSGDPLTLICTLTLLGVAISIYHPVGISMISLGVRARGWGMGINGIAGSLGVALGAPLGMFALAHGAWHWAYYTLAILSGLGFVLLWLMLRWFPRMAQLTGKRLTPASLSAGTLLPVDARTQTQYAPLFLLLAVMMLGGLNYRCLVSALPSHLTGLDPEVAKREAKSTLVFLTLLTGCVGQFFGGWVAERRWAKFAYLGFIALLVPAGFLLAQSSPGTNSAVPWACLVALCLFAQQPIENTLMGEITTRAKRTSWFGIKFALTFGIGAFGLPITGAIWNHYAEVGLVFYVLAGSAGLMCLLVLVFIARLKPRT